MITGILMSLNDPQWGNNKGSNQGPPDLEDLWRDFNRRLSGLFGKKGAEVRAMVDRARRSMPRFLAAGSGPLSCLSFWSGWQADSMSSMPASAAWS